MTGGEGTPDVPARCGRLEGLIPAVVVLAVALVYAPMAATGSRLSDNEDFLQNAARHAFLRKSVLEHHALPLRSHFFGSGYPTLGEPEDPALNPFAWLLLPFPTPLALKLRFLIGAAAAALGTYLLARGPLRYTRWGAAFAAISFPLCFWFPWQIAGGNMNEVYFAFLPLILFLLLTAPRRPWRFVLLVFLMYVVLSDGKHILMIMCLYVFVLWGVRYLIGGSGPEKTPRRARVQPLAWLAAALVFTVLVGMARILPAMTVLSQRGGIVGLDLATHGGSVAYPRPMDVAFGLAGLRSMKAGARILHVGLMPVLLFIGALALDWRRVLPWAVTVFLFGWIVVGPNAGLDLNAALRLVPFFGTLERPLKYCAPLIAFSICMGAGAFFGPLMALPRAKLGHVLAVLALFGTAHRLISPAVMASVLAFPVAGPQAVMDAAGLRPVPFHSVQGRGMTSKRSRPRHANGYFNVLRNVGTIDWYTALPLPAHGRPRYYVERDGRVIENPDYRGEAYLAARGAACGFTFEPNRIRVRVPAVAEPDVLVINQNFDRGWRAVGREVCPRARDRLLALDVAGGAQEVELRYRSRPFEIGLAVSGIGVLLLAAFVVLRRRGGLAFLDVRGGEASGPPATGCLPAWAFMAVIGFGTVTSFAGVGLVRWEPLIYTVAGDEAMRQGTREVAVAAYQMAVQVGPRSARAWLKLGSALEETDQFHQAVEAYRRAVALDPTSARSHNNLGVALARLGRRRRATAHFLRAVELDPRSEGARANLARALELMKTESTAPLERSRNTGDMSHNQREGGP